LKPSTFYVYNASAGSGKTYALVKEYIKTLLLSNKEFPFKHILAITFTNKAVAEMKERIIDALKAFSEDVIPKEYESLLADIANETPLTPTQIQAKSQIILKKIVYNYAAFDVSTIDRFTQKLNRAFAFDLKLPLNFDVALDTEEIILEAIDVLISKTGTEKTLTKVIVDFALEKTDDDRSFNIEYDLNQIAKLLLNENDFEHVSRLRTKSLNDFIAFKSQLQKEAIALFDQIRTLAKNLIKCFEAQSIDHSDFSGSYLPKHFIKLSQGQFNVNFTAKWQENIESGPLYPKRVSTTNASVIDELRPQILHAFLETQQLISKYNFNRAVQKNLTPLSVLNEINKEVQSIKEERSLILISEFNTVVSEYLSQQPAPFIYERVGEKFKHYFIDEFQDTSVMQWQNLIPLVDNALAAENSSLLVVGDAKQAIYRWRGGKAEQFIAMYSETENPFKIKPLQKDLGYNYRSQQQIVDFNNAFFKHLSTFAFSSNSYGQLFERSFQKVKKNEEGCVSITLLEQSGKIELEDAYCKEVETKIVSCLQNGFDLKDICVLVRKKKEGVRIAKHLIEESKIDIISSETMLLTHSPEVMFIINMLKLLLDSKNKELMLEVLTYIATYKLELEDKHKFIVEHIDSAINDIIWTVKNDKSYKIFDKTLNLTLYETVEQIIVAFGLVTNSNAYVQFFLDEVLSFSNAHSTSISGFVNYFEQKKDALSITSSNEKNAVRIMTIHKSKGLEFPVVIFPFADLDIYKEQNAKVWYALEKDKYHGFEYALLNYNKQLQDFGEQGNHLYLQHKAELELDNINLLYVAQTRPIEQLHIISSKKIDKNGKENMNTYSGLFINYLKHKNLWHDSQFTYTFGNLERNSGSYTKQTPTDSPSNFIATPLKELAIQIATSSGLLWDTKQKEALEKGNLLHFILSKIKTSADVPFVFDDLFRNGIISHDQVEILKTTINQILNHPQLKSYFSPDFIVYNEREIINRSGHILIPDRLVFLNEKDVVVIDYKTGLVSSTHDEQIYTYKEALEKMKLAVKKMLLIYINDDITIKEV